MPETNLSRLAIEALIVLVSSGAAIRGWAKERRASAEMKAAQKRAADAEASAADAQRAATLDEKRELSLSNLITRLDQRVERAEKEITECNEDRRNLREENARQHADLLSRVEKAEARASEAARNAAQYDGILAGKIAESETLRSWIERMVGRAIEVEKELGDEAS